jgi:ATP-binding cassette, subfamily B, bacterial
MKSSKHNQDTALRCLRSVAQHHGKIISLTSLRSHSSCGFDGKTLPELAQLAETMGFRARCLSLDLKTLRREIPLPCIVRWEEHGFVVVKKNVQNQFSIGIDDDTVTVSAETFRQHWLPEGSQEGEVMVLDTTPGFGQNDESDHSTTPKGLRSLWAYLQKYPKLLVQICIGMLIGTILKLMVPFLTQSIVDIGVMTHNLNFIYIFLAGQLMLIVGRNSIEAIRGWLLLYVSTRVGVSLLTDLIAKITRLPIGYFNEKAVGEVMQRVEDQKRIETFLSTHLTAILFALANLVIYTFIFALYDMTIFGIFVGATVLYLGWISLFMKKRRQYDFKRAKIAEQEQNKLVQMVQGMPDIKLANAEILKRWDWEQVRGKLFLQNIKLLKLSQLQQIGGLFINEIKLLIITFLSAKAVLDGDLSLGAMLAVQQMLGQTTGPTEQLFAYFQQIQDARISTERIGAVHDLPDEEANDYTKVCQLPEDKPIIMRDVHFQYPTAATPTLRDIDLYIPAGKTTAIVGSSGSGKTTLLKLLMKHYAPTDGQVSFGKLGLNQISTSAWRNQCGVVMSDGVIFADSILHNIALGDPDPDLHKVRHAAKIACIHEWITATPMGYHTVIGNEQGSLSQGQKQRLLIARAVYKNPKFLFFDEGTSALDVQNQQVIMRNLETFFEDRTVVVVAHRLSTIRNADQIVVIEDGQIIEKGTHDQLLAAEGRYYDMLTTQLEAAA